MVQSITSVFKVRQGKVVVFSALVLLPVFGPAAGARPLEPVTPTAVAAGPLGDRLQLWKRGSSDVGVLVVDSLLAERIDQLRGSSRSFAAAWDELGRSGIPLVIGSKAEIDEILPPDVRASSAWAGMTVTWNDGGGSLDRAAVAIRVEWVAQLHDLYHTPPGAYEEALDGLIIHEVYGHLVPVVAARDARKQCSDPRGGERLADSCVGKREAFVKAERQAGTMRPAE